MTKKAHDSRRNSDDSESASPTVPLDNVEEAVQETLARVLREQVKLVDDENDRFRTRRRRSSSSSRRVALIRSSSAAGRRFEHSQEGRHGGRV